MRPEKKSETIEIRLPYTQKLAFMRACAARGVTASDALRTFIGDFVSDDEQPHHAPAFAPQWAPRRGGLFAAGLSAGALLLGLAPAAVAAPATRDTKETGGMDGAADLGATLTDLPAAVPMGTPCRITATRTVFRVEAASLPQPISVTAVSSNLIGAQSPEDVAAVMLELDAALTTAGEAEQA